MAVQSDAWNDWQGPVAGRVSSADGRIAGRQGMAHRAETLDRQAARDRVFTGIACRNRPHGASPLGTPAALAKELDDFLRRCLGFTICAPAIPGSSRVTAFSGAGLTRKIPSPGGCTTIRRRPGTTGRPTCPMFRDLILRNDCIRPRCAWIVPSFICGALSAKGINIWSPQIFLHQ